MTTKKKCYGALRNSWYLATLGPMPLLFSGIMAQVHLQQFELGYWNPEIPEIIEWAFAGCLLGFSALAGKAVLRKRLKPKLIAQQSLPFGVQTDTTTEHAKELVLKAMRIGLCIYVIPSILLATYTHATGDFQWIIAATVFMTTIGLMAKPNLKKLLEETQHELENVD